MKATHRKACWPDITDPKEQAYAERRRLARVEAQKIASTEAAQKAMQKTS